MGRTYRNRHRNKTRREERPVSLGEDRNYLGLVSWLSAQRWSPTCQLAPVLFHDTGRGMLAKRNIPAHTILASLPRNILITVETVVSSNLSAIFLNSDHVFSTQQVLSVFLVWQKHLGDSSFWLPYLNILPREYHSLVFSSEGVADSFPKVISDKVRVMKFKIEELYESLQEAVGDKCCGHCGEPYSELFTFELFQWAWFTVNSRSVYFSPSLNDNCDVNLIDSNSIALAPFLDMINHSDQAKVNVLYDEKNHSYNIVTLVPFRKNQEVFINYGGHSNQKLYLEYGFILPKNRNDSVPFIYDDIIKTVQTVVPNCQPVPKNRFNFLKSHGFLSNLYCCHEGLSWNARALIYVLLEPLTVELGEIQKAIFSSSFRLPDENTMSSILLELFLDKKKQFRGCIERLEQLSSETSGEQCKVTIETGVELLKIYLGILDYNVTKRV